MTDEMELDRQLDGPHSTGKAHAELAGCVDRPHHPEAALAALARLDAPSLRAALKATRSALGQGSAP